MALKTAVLGTLYEVLTDAHLREDLDVLDFVMKCSRDAGGTGSGAAWSIEIEVPNPGISLLAPNSPRFLAFIDDNGTNSLATSTVLARGRIVPMQGDLGGLTVRLAVVCAPADIQGKLFEFSKGYWTGPEFDRLFDDISFDKPESILEARSATFHIDPVSHAISLNDIIDGDRVVDLADNYDFNSLRVKNLAPPVATARLSVSCEFEQRSRGICDISQIINILGLSTLNPQTMEHAGRGLPGSLIHFNLGAGWKQDSHATLFSCTVRDSAPLKTGRDDTLHYVATNPNNPGVNRNYSQDGDEWGTLAQWDYSALRCNLEYDYQQQRRENLTLLVSIPLQNVVGVLAEQDLGELRLKDLHQMFYANPTPPPEPDQWGNYIFPYEPQLPVKPWDYNTIYNEGDEVELNGLFYKAKRQTSGYFWRYNNTAQWEYTSGGVQTFNNIIIDWENIQSTAAIPDMRQPNFLDTPRGLQVIQHAILRARAALRKRLQCMETSVETPWEYGAGITMRDRVRVEIYSTHDGVKQLQPVVGKVKEIERHWSSSGRIVKLTLAIEAGTSANAIPTPANPTIYVDPSYTTEPYVVQGNGSDGAFRDVTYRVVGNLLLAPVDAFRLHDPGYAVYNSSIENTAPQQLAVASVYANELRDPADAAHDYPTRMQLNMRHLGGSGVIERNFDVVAEVTVSPRGIDLSTPGGEP